MNRMALLNGGLVTTIAPGWSSRRSHSGESNEPSPSNGRAARSADPDVFDPDERIVKPFAGLGPDVGQAAMLRLAAKHRGVTGALALARWDPGIEYVTADAKTHTFRMEHDRPGIGYYSDGSTYPIGHTVITANGIKPASVMSWIHNEKPGTPEWEARTRTRFEESNGGEWKPAETDVI